MSLAAIVDTFYCDSPAFFLGVDGTEGLAGIQGLGAADTLHAALRSVPFR